MKWWAVLALLLLVQESAGSKILFISAIASKSHKGFFSAVANALADNGHQITMVSPYKPAKVRKNIHEVVLEGLELTSVLPNMFSNTLSGPKAIIEMAPKICADAMERKEVQDLLKEEFDLMIITIFMSDCFLSMARELNVPFIYVNPAGLIGPVVSTMGSPYFSSFLPSRLLHASHPMKFHERLMGALIDTMMENVVRFVAIPNIESECRRRGLCPEEMPALEEMRANASIMLVNGLRTIEDPPQPSMPSIVYCGGIHIKDAKPLPEDLEEWVAGAGEEGFIFFSLGSVVKPSNMPEEHRQILVKVFGSLKQRVLWKWDEDSMEDLPPNVRLSKWLPQQDILGHPSLRLFITHGGALSTQESMYHGVTVLGLPVFADQISNMMEVQQQGWGRVIFWDELNTELLHNTILSLMTDEKLKSVVKQKSALMRDVPQPATEVVNFWVDYVIRHKGAPHLKSPTLSMTWYQIYNVDVWATVVVAISLILYLILKLLLAICKFLFSSKSKAKKD